MEIIAHELNGIKAAEVISPTIIIANEEEGLNLLGNLYYQNFDVVIIYAKNITPAFFDLKNGIAGEILQKFSNYRVKLAIIGDFDYYTSNGLRDFIVESNQTGQVIFIREKSEALSILAKKRVA